MIAGTGSRHLVPKESLLGSASRPARPNAGLRAGIGVSVPGGTGWGRLVLLKVLPSDHGHQALRVAR
jgi:hypothetical protein